MFIKACERTVCAALSSVERESTSALSNPEPVHQFSLIQVLYISPLHGEGYVQLLQKRITLEEESSLVSLRNSANSVSV